MNLQFVCYNDITENYRFCQEIGGAFSQVRRAIFVEESKQVAIKVIDKQKYVECRTRITQSDLQMYLNQCEILFYLEHPNIIQIYEVYDNTYYFYIVMEYMAGGELCQEKNIHRCQTEAQIAQIVNIITDALDFCHRKKIAHRDIKNILWSTDDQYAVLKIADFGFAKIVGPNLLTTACGTHGEAIHHSSRLLGIRCYHLHFVFCALRRLSGRPPFLAEDEEDLYESIKFGRVEFPERQWMYISFAAKDLIVHMLEKNPNKRYDADRIRKHPWLNLDHNQVKLHQERFQNIKLFNTRRKKTRFLINQTLSEISQEYKSFCN